MPDRDDGHAVRMHVPLYDYEPGGRIEELLADDRLYEIVFGRQITATWRIACDFCGDDFIAHHPGSRYCSDDHRVIAQRDKNRERTRRYRASATR